MTLHFLFSVIYFRKNLLYEAILSTVPLCALKNVDCLGGFISLSDKYSLLLS